MYAFRWPTQTLVGAGLMEDVDQHLAPPPGGGRVLLVAPQEEWVAPLLERTTRRLQEAGWDSIEPFAGVEPNPSWDTVERGEERGTAAGVDTVLAIGGGSTLDAGKVIAERCGALLLCTVPTTAGTGSEISPWAVITNLETREKDSVVAKWPDVAILDPALTLTLPARITLFTGIDAFIHGLEAYISSAAQPITDALALKGMELVAAHLRTAVERGEDLDARQGMMEGCLLTGAAMLHAGLGLMHAIGNVAGGLYHHLPHGQILMACMDPVLDFNRPALGEKYTRVAPIVDRARDTVASLFTALDVPPVEIAGEDLSLLAERAIENVNAQTNPRPADQQTVERLVHQAFRVK